MTSIHFVVPTLVQRFFTSFLFALLPIAVQAQFHRTDSLLVSPSDSVVTLSSEFILQKSTIVILDDDTLHGKDYDLDERNGRILLHGHVRARLRTNSSHPSRIIVSYSFLPVSFNREYFLKSLEIRKDTTGKEIKTVKSPISSFSVGDLFTSSMQKSGSLARGITVGSNRDLSLTSGFRLQMNGQLSRDVDVVAVLTDEHTPLQPEGTTQTLQEVDKVFVEFKHPVAGATLGDFQEEIGRKRGGEFGRLNRKLQGARGTAGIPGLWGSGNKLEFAITGGSPRGKFFTIELRGQEGNQGPYRLIGAGGERQIIVIAGTERVYVDGVQMTRGEVNDYTVDYASAEITFTSRRLITSASRIVVDYEYTDRSYERNFFGVSAGGSLMNERVRVNALVVQETDDSESPIDISFDDAARALLAQSGSDPLKASRSGVTFSGRDSVSGGVRGQYVRRDTVIDGRSYPIYQYQPGDSLALYSVSFSPVEFMPGDSAGYERVALGHYRFVGIGRGTHLPLTILPLPSLQRLVDVNAEVSILKDLVISGEFAGSRYDRNRLSNIDDGINDDQAMKLSVRYSPRNLSLLGMKNGEIDLAYSERFVGKRFTPMDRMNEVEFGRKWNIEGLSVGDESIREISATVKPAALLRIGGTYGSFDRTGIVTSDRIEGYAAVGDSDDVDVQYKIEQISARKSEQDARSVWLRQGGLAAYQWDVLRPSVRIDAEHRELRTGGGDSLGLGSFRFVQWTPSLQTRELFHMKGYVEFQVRSEDSSLAGRLRHAFSSLTQTYGWELREWNDLSATFTLSARKTRFEETFRLRGNGNSDVLMVRSHVRHTLFRRAFQTDLFYEFTNQRSARMERVYVRVAKGEGNYRYLGDQNNNSLPDETEFELTRFDGDYIVLFLPAEALVPVANVKSSVRIRFQPARIVNEATFLGSLLAPVTTETYARIDERSADRDTRNVYFLNLATFLNHQHTLAGSQLFTQDLHLFENNLDFSTRWRFNQRRGLVQLVSSTEESFVRERSLRVRTQLMPELGNETEVIERTDRLISSVSGPRDRDLRGFQLSSDFSYRPDREWEVGWRIQLETTKELLNGDRAVADVNIQSVRVVYAFVRRGQVRMEGAREEAVLSTPSMIAGKVYPYEFTQGRHFGRSFLWSLNLEYRLTKNIQMTVHYAGRSEGGGTPVHLARAEAKAFF